MGGFFRALSAGARAAVGAFGAGSFSAAGRRIRCHHCGSERFSMRSVPIHTVGGLFGHRGYALRCERCSQVLFFAEAPERE